MTDEYNARPTGNSWQTLYSFCTNATQVMMIYASGPEVCSIIAWPRPQTIWTLWNGDLICMVYYPLACISRVSKKTRKKKKNHIRKLLIHPFKWELDRSIFYFAESLKCHYSGLRQRQRVCQFFQTLWLSFNKSQHVNVTVYYNQRGSHCVHVLQLSSPSENLRSSPLTGMLLQFLL